MWFIFLLEKWPTTHSPHPGVELNQVFARFIRPGWKWVGNKNKQGTNFVQISAFPYVGLVCGVGGHLFIVAFLFFCRKLKCHINRTWRLSFFISLSPTFPPPPLGQHTWPHTFLSAKPIKLVMLGFLFGLFCGLTSTFFRSWHVLLVPSMEAYLQMSIRVSVSHRHWRRLNMKNIVWIFFLCPILLLKNIQDGDFLQSINATGLWTKSVLVSAWNIKN